MGTIQIKKVERTVTTGKTGETRQKAKKTYGKITADYYSLFRNFDFVEVTFVRKYKEKQHFPLYFDH